MIIANNLDPDKAPQNVGPCLRSKWFDTHIVNYQKNVMEKMNCQNSERMKREKNTYCAYHVLVQPNFRRYYFYFLPDQAQIFLDHFKV